MDSIDTSKRKPRRTFGTPSYAYRNRFAYALLAAGTVLFGIWNLTPIQRVANEKLAQALAQTEQERDRKALFEFAAPRTSQFIKDAIKESEEQNTK
ncbi:uncharacterized protein Dana_GF27022, isoform A [Drosophila ananassae]|uniref:Uncharacterized protein, isoform A n=1 Tax=Drosophila ananassae TaxID=7217 RepID=A0A0N8P111_DROAN|nr:uncharacterized protein LOC26514431 [Drosophila ananassae]KAH8345794.1 hypothetical protein KR067_005821 [Drosophila pandora]KPU78628.1 uncharacterized protein Dana_GF27022, isoform A [Drosophila ananassae]